jgi:hypothetical protein
MMTLIHDGIKSYIYPDCAKCMLAEKYIDDMNECPIWQCEGKDECDPDCAFYTEEWECRWCENEIPL